MVVVGKLLGSKAVAMRLDSMSLPSTAAHILQWLVSASVRAFSLGHRWQTAILPLRAGAAPELALPVSTGSIVLFAV